MKELDYDKLNKIIFEIQEEFIKSTMNFPKFNSPHEGYAILLEEVDELWENIKLNQSTPGRIELIIDRHSVYIIFLCPYQESNLDPTLKQSLSQVCVPGKNRTSN